MIVENPEDSYHMEDTKKFLPNESVVGNKLKFSGLSREEVEAFSADPSWVRLRWILFSLFWLTWLALLGAAVAIVVLTPRCPHRPQMNWYQQEIAYQIDVQKFKDSNGDGFGDLSGILDKLSYFKDLGVQTLALRSNILDDNSPINFQKKFLDNSTPKEFKKALKANDLHVILDVPYSYINSNETQNVLSSWLSVLDGVRVTEVPANVDKKLIQKWTELAQKIGAEEFETKFIAFHPYNPAAGDDIQASTAIKTLLTRNLYESDGGKEEFLKSFQARYEDDDNKLWPSYMTGDYSSDRLGSIIKDKKQLEVTHGILLLIKNTPFILYGDELEFSGRDEYMKWDSSLNCGFSSNKTIQIDQACENSVRDSFSHGAGENLVRMYEKLSLLRKEPSFLWGNVEINDNVESIFSFVREAPGFDGYLVAANVADKKSGSTDFESLHNIPKNGTVSYFYSNNEMSVNEFKVGMEVYTERILLKPGELLVVRFDKRQ